MPKIIGIYCVWFMIKPIGGGTFPKCEANYGLVLGPFWELPHPSANNLFIYFAPHESKIKYLFLNICLGFVLLCTTSSDHQRM